MVWFKIITLEEVDTWLGTIKPGEELNKIDMENLKEAKEWAYDAYGPYGENIKHKVMRC